MQIVDLAQIIQNVKLSRFIVMDRAVSENYRDLRLELSNKVVFYLDSPEEQKELREIEKCLNYFLENHITRDEKILAMGGGATTDFAGFVAATVLRGIDWEAYPTTLLAMIDASIGGKVGVNSNYGKNLIGSFHLPSEIFVCSEFLSTLPKEELLSGYGELTKYTFLSSRIFKLIEHKESIPLLIKECAFYKDKLVKNDFKENGERKLLNLGHSFGHPIEKLTKIPHGLAVLIGLKIIIDIYAPHLKPKYSQAISLFDFQMDIPAIDFNEFLSFLKKDKKVKKDATIDLIIPYEIGDVRIENHSLESIEIKLKEYEYFNTFFY